MLNDSAPLYAELHKVISEATTSIYKQRDEWVRETLKKSGYDLVSFESRLLKHIVENAMSQEDSESFIRDEVSKFYENGKITLILDTHYQMEILVIDGVPVGIWKSNLSLGAQLEPDVNALYERVKTIMEAYSK